MKAMFQVQQLWQIIFIFLYFLLQTGYTFLLILFLQPIFFYGARFLKQNTLCTWLCSCFSLVFITIYKKYVLFSNYPDRNECLIHLFSVSISWINLKCTSFYLENFNSTNFLNLISYCFYPPTIFTGPFILCEDFKNVYTVSNKLQDKVLKFVINLMRCILWYIFGMCCLHFVYVSATSYQPQVSIQVQ